MSATVRAFRGHVLALVSIAPGDGRYERTRLVAEAQRQPVDLGLGREGQRRGLVQPQEAADAGNEIRDLDIVIGLAERQHGHPVSTLGEALGRRSPDLRCRAVPVGKNREDGLERFQPAAERIVLGVGDGRGVIAIIALVVLRDLDRELGVLRLGSPQRRTGRGIARRGFGRHEGTR
jgi:hypothetical protein